MDKLETVEKGNKGKKGHIFGWWSVPQEKPRVSKTVCKVEPELEPATLKKFPHWMLDCYRIHLPLEDVAVLPDCLW